MDERNPIDEPFPWAALFGAIVIILVVLAVALTTGTCSMDSPC